MELILQLSHLDRCPGLASLIIKPVFLHIKVLEHGVRTFICVISIKMSSFRTSASIPGGTRRSWIATQTFSDNFYSYKNGRWGANPGTPETCPIGRILRENGRKLYPAAYPNVDQFYVGVYDPVSFLNGFIDPNSAIFAPFNQDKPTYVGDSRDRVFDPFYPNRADLGPPVFTNGNIVAVGTYDISNNGTTLVNYVGIRADASGNNTGLAQPDSNFSGAYFSYVPYGPFYPAFPYVGIELNIPDGPKLETYMGTDAYNVGEGFDLRTALQMIHDTDTRVLLAADLSGGGFGGGDSAAYLNLNDTSGNTFVDLFGNNNVSYLQFERENITRVNLYADASGYNTELSVLELRNTANDNTVTLSSGTNTAIPSISTTGAIMLPYACGLLTLGGGANAHVDSAVLPVFGLDNVIVSLTRASTTNNYGAGLYYTINKVAKKLTIHSICNGDNGGDNGSVSWVAHVCA